MVEDRRYGGIDIEKSRRGGARKGRRGKQGKEVRKERGGPGSHLVQVMLVLRSQAPLAIVPPLVAHPGCQLRILRPVEGDIAIPMLEAEAQEPLVHLLPWPDNLLKLKAQALEDLDPLCRQLPVFVPVALVPYPCDECLVLRPGLVS